MASAPVAQSGAQMVGAGFVHGVLNTDNINITGESFDYGPWRFLPSYDPLFVAAYFDETGLYAFGRQPDALAWNLTRLAECLVPLSRIDLLEPEVNRFWPAFKTALADAILDRLGLSRGTPEQDEAFIATLYDVLGDLRPAYEQFFFDWRGGRLGLERAQASPQGDIYRTAGFAPLKALILEREPFAPSVAFGVDQLVMPSASASAFRVKSLFPAGL